MSPSSNSPVVKAGLARSGHQPDGAASPEPQEIATVWDRYKSQQPQCKFGTDGRLLPALPHGAVPHHRQGPARASAARTRTPSSRATCCARSPRGRRPTPTTAAPGADAQAGGRGQGRRLQDRRRAAAARGGAVLRDRPRTAATDLEIAGGAGGFLHGASSPGRRQPNRTLRLAPEKRQALWKKLGIEPTGHRPRSSSCCTARTWAWTTTTGTSSWTAFRTAPGRRLGRLARSPPSSRDILFGTPTPVRSRVNLGVLARRPGQHPRPRPRAGALRDARRGLAGPGDRRRREGRRAPRASTWPASAARPTRSSCATASPSPGNFLQQELAIVTGAVEMMIIDVQCCMPTPARGRQVLPHRDRHAPREIAKTIGAEHIAFDESTRYEHAPRPDPRGPSTTSSNRDPRKVRHPERVEGRWWPGFSVEAIKYMLGGTLPRHLPPAQRRHHQRPDQGRRRASSAATTPRRKVDDYTSTPDARS